jgi:anti-anti-sigma regulatory factor
VLKINITNSRDEQRWSLHGRLVGQWAAELRAAWKEARRDEDTRRCVIELIDVTFIDQSGEDVLAEIIRQGAEFVASGVYVKHLLGSLGNELRRPRAKKREHEDSGDSR